MQSDPGVIEALNEVLTAELTAINQYFIHHKMCENWGYKRLSQKKREESIDEMKDADDVIERILYFEGVPNMQRLYPVRVGEDPIEQHRLDLELETEAIARLNKGIALCRDKRHRLEQSKGERLSLPRNVAQEPIDEQDDGGHFKEFFKGVKDAVLD